MIGRTFFQSGNIFPEFGRRGIACNLRPAFDGRSGTFRIAESTFGNGRIAVRFDFADDGRSRRLNIGYGYFCQRRKCDFFGRCKLFFITVKYIAIRGSNISPNMIVRFFGQFGNPA